MRRWAADGLGLLIGSAIGAALLVQYGPRLQAFVNDPGASPTIVRAAPDPHRPPARRVVAGATASAPLQPAPASPLPRPNAPSPEPAGRDRLALLPAPMPLPAVIPAPLPAIIHPGGPPRTPNPGFTPGSAYAGTGFFIAFDGTLLTAAHVVTDCPAPRIVGPQVAPTVARVLASDPSIDLALLNTTAFRPPAILPIGPAPPTGRVFVLGYPASAGMRVAEEDWADLRSDRVLRAGGVEGAAGAVWLETARITHGYSGGPVVDPHSGAAIALVRAEIDGPGMTAIIGRGASHMATGPTGERLARFVRREAPWLALDTAPATDALAAARAATVHVICLH